MAKAMNTYIVLNPTSRIDDDAVAWFHEKNYSTRKQLFIKHYVSHFNKKFLVVRIEPHGENGALDGFFVIKVQDNQTADVILSDIKNEILLVDESWGCPYYYFAVFIADDAFIEAQTHIDVSKLVSQARYMPIEILKYNYKDDYKSLR